MNIADLLRRADEVLDLGTRALASEREERWLSLEAFAAFRGASLSFLRLVFGEAHPYYKDFAERVTNPSRGYAELGVGLLSAARQELAGGWLVTTRGLISAEIFADFLEMAEYLLSENYKDAAAVIAGAALEEHLRQLAVKHGVSATYLKAGSPVPKKADLLNADLATASAYSKLDQKTVTAWLDLRNKAAHGRYAEYDGKQVALMVEGVRQFMARVPV